MSHAVASYPSSLCSSSSSSSTAAAAAVNSHPPPLSSLGKLSLNPNHTADWSVTLRDGLPTPPSDMSGVAFNAAQLAPSSYLPNHNSTVSSNKQQPHLSLSHSHVAKSSSNRVPLASTVSNAVPNNNNNNTATAAAATTTANNNNNNIIIISNNNNNDGNNSYLPPMAKDAMLIDSKPHKRTNNDGSVSSYLRIPASINRSGGNLAEFASQIACLFWFEKTSKLQAIEENLVQRYALVPESIPTAGFQKWVTSVLSTTQVSQNVILLALLFIYRLKKFNPGVRGKKGSEFRLMTIALMMGNKFLDDNTYTNKTWAEVSGISVQEIHIMEVEFLSNVRYNLFVSKEEWTRWHYKLGCFADFFDKASRMPFETELPPTTPVFQISPSLQPTASGWKSLPASPSSKLPSPPVTNHLQPTQLWGAGAPANNNGAHPRRAHTPPRHLPNIEFPPYPRKRSADLDDHHPSKRMAVIPGATYTPMLGMNPAVPSASNHSIPVLPPVVTDSGNLAHVPTLGVPVPRFANSSMTTATTTTSGSMPNNVVPPVMPSAVSSQQHQHHHHHHHHHHQQQQQQQQLPLPNMRAMSTVFTPTTTTTTTATVTTWSQPMPAVASTTTVTPQSMNSMGLYNPAVSLPDPNRRQSPYPTGGPAGTASSPVYPVHTPQSHLSPSFFLGNRNSPYRPVRAVNTLLIPPPPASLQQPRNLSMDQMHYQPLGKTVTERRRGVLPYLHQEAWPQGPISQPNFLPSQSFGP